MSQTTAFTPLASLMGGVLIGSSAILLMLAVGRIAGISGLIQQVLKRGSAEETRWHASLFLLGVMAAVPGYWLLTDAWPDPSVSDDPLRMGVAGALVGFGATFANGCTSGHGVCGISRCSVRSILATATIIFFGMLTVGLMRHYLGG